MRIVEVNGLEQVTFEPAASPSLVSSYNAAMERDRQKRNKIEAAAMRRRDAMAKPAPRAAADDLGPLGLIS